MIERIKVFFEKRAFGVCAWWGEKLGLSTNKIRLSFIYLSFLTFGSPLIIYLIMAFVLEHKEFFKLRRSKRPSIWDI